MKTTLIGFGKCGEEVLKKCSDLSDTRFVLFSDAEAPYFIYQQQSPNELVITVSYAARYDYMAKLYPDEKDNFSLRYQQEAKKIKLIIDEGMENYDSSARRPYLRLRGKRVTEEQAFDIIRRTDRLSPWSEELSCDDQIRSGNFSNNWTRQDLYPAPFGWVHPNGIVGVDGIAGNIIKQTLRFIP